MSLETAADGLKQEMVDFTRQLIAIRTVDPPGDKYPEAVAFLEHACKEMGLRTRKAVVPAAICRKHGIDPAYPRISLIAETGSGRTVHLNGHYDVVPATSGWKTDPFDAVIRSGRIYGRGAADMKGNIASMLFAYRILKAAGLKPKYRLQYSFVPDEEIGGRLGFQYLVGKGLVDADFVIGEGHSDDQVSYGSKGLLWLKVEVIGKSSHAAYAYKGRNAFEYACSLAEELKVLKIKIEKRQSRHAFSDKRQRSPTLVMGGLLEGGTKVNTVPDRVTFSIDRRLIPEETADSAMKEIASVIGRFVGSHPGIKVRLIPVAEDASVTVDTEGALMQSFASAVRAVNGRCSFRLLSGGTDTRWLLRKGIPGVGYSPSCGNLHADDEYVDIGSMVKTALVYARFLSS
jgi:succinyl-diaminopimelate desuccinylase